MANVERKAQVDRLNTTCFNALDAAYKLAAARANRSLELGHWLHLFLQVPGSDLPLIFAAFNVDTARVQSDIVVSLEKLRRGSGAPPTIADSVDEAMTEAILYALLRFKEARVRSGHILLGAMTARGLREELLGMSAELKKIPVERLIEEFPKIVAGSSEDAGPEPEPIPGDPAAAAPGAMGQQGEAALDKFTEDLTAKAKSGKMDPVVGRDPEIRQCIDILMRRRQNNPILTGEAGVGKTAVVEGFAQRVAAGDVPGPLKNARVLALDVGLLQAGASVKGEFESRLRKVIDEVKASAKPIVLFIDEAHTLVGAGGAAGQNDAANLLKPALARGQLRTIAATTQAEYKKYIEKDPALTRRFQVVKVDEPDEKRALIMIRRLADVLESNYKLVVLDEALEAAVRLSRRYIHGRQLPDKAVSLIETACARVAVSHDATPGEIEDTSREIDAVKDELRLLARETAIGSGNAERNRELTTALKAHEDRLADLTQRFEKERAIVTQLSSTYKALRQPSDSGAGGAPVPGAPSPAEREHMLAEVKNLQTKLAALQGERPLMLPAVDANVVAKVVADWTGVPVGRMVRDEAEGVLKLGQTLNQRVIGQRHALDAIASRIQLSRAKLDNPGRPIGVFMLVGPSGVGKTETAVALAETLYGGPQALITINMSEFQEAHKVSTLMGSPPGYVGYGQGGVLTEAVRRRPYSIVLLDEVEKAHSDVHEIFFQVFDKGMMKDSEGVDIDFKNTIILLTSNAGTEVITDLCQDPALRPDPDALGKALREPLLKVFPPALLGRINVIPYYPLSDEMIRGIIKLQFRKIEDRVRDGHKVAFTYDPEVVETVAQRTTESESGARAIDAIITRQMLPRIGREILERVVSGEPVRRVHVSVKNGEFEYAF
ncbi:MAG: type VI secretion system ATPase TssH [Planctomycetota bacterium]|nr:type VI secretion system ATPase TssH [Planctomycetota bacterium]